MLCPTTIAIYILTILTNKFGGKQILNMILTCTKEHVCTTNHNDSTSQMQKLVFEVYAVQQSPNSLIQISLKSTGRNHSEITAQWLVVFSSTLQAFSCRLKTHSEKSYFSVFYPKNILSSTKACFVDDTSILFDVAAVIKEELGNYKIKEKYNNEVLRGSNKGSHGTNCKRKRCLNYYFTNS